MLYDELDETRPYMLDEFDKEQRGGNPYRSRALSDQGLVAFPALMRSALAYGNERTLAESIVPNEFWTPQESYTRNGVTRLRNRNIPQSAERLALTEFNTWYVCGFASRLLGEGVELCQVVRGGEPKWEPSECTEHEGQTISVELVYRNHRARYWPEPGDPSAFSIPFGPGCHHIIGRCR